MTDPARRRMQMQAWMETLCPHKWGDWQMGRFKKDCPDCLLAYGTERALSLIDELESISCARCQETARVAKAALRARREGC